MCKAESNSLVTFKLLLGWDRFFLSIEKGWRGKKINVVCIGVISCTYSFIAAQWVLCTPMGLRGASGIRTKMFMTRSPPIYSCFSFSWVLSHLYRAKRSILSLFSWVWLLLLFFFLSLSCSVSFPKQSLRNCQDVRHRSESSLPR